MSHARGPSWVVCALLAGGCARTEVVVHIDAEGLAVPGDLDRLSLLVTNPDDDPSGRNPLYASPGVTLCGANRPSGCVSFPVGLTLYPGSKKPDARVRVEVDALAGGNVVIADAATFTFVKGASQRLDFVLAHSCLQTRCAAMDEVCDASGRCVAAVTTGPGASTDMVPHAIERLDVTSSMIAADAFELPTPPSARVGDLLLLALGAQNNTTNLVAPAGWSEAGDVFTAESGHAYVFLHTVAAADPPSTRFDHTGYDNYRALAFTYRGVGGVDARMSGYFPSGPMHTLPPVRVAQPGAIVWTALAQYTFDCMGPLGTPSGQTTWWNTYEYAATAAGAGGGGNVSCGASNTSDGAYFELVLLPQ